MYLKRREFVDRCFIKLLLISLEWIVCLSLHKRIFVFCTTQLKDITDA